MQSEATTLAAQLTLLQRDTNGLTANNSELKLKLQTTEQQPAISRRLWGNVKSLESLQPYAKCRSRYTVPSKRNNGFIYAKIFGGFEKIRTSICDLGTITRLLNATLVPFAVVFSWHDKAMQFESFGHHIGVDDNSEGHGKVGGKNIIPMILPKSIKMVSQRFQGDLEASNQEESSKIQSQTRKGFASRDFFVSKLVPMGFIGVGQLHAQREEIILITTGSGELDKLLEVVCVPCLIRAPVYFGRQSSTNMACFDSLKSHMGYLFGKSTLKALHILSIYLVPVKRSLYFLSLVTASNLLLILKNGPFTPMERIKKSTDGDMVIPAHYGLKYPSKYTETKKEKVSLDSGTKEVRSKQRRIQVSQCEGLMAKPKESITDVFVRFNKLINYLQIHDKYYEVEEVYLKFLLTLPNHVEQKISAIRNGGDLSKMTLETPTVSSVEQKNDEPQKQVILQYKETVEKMSVEMFHIHTSMVAATEEMSRLSKVNEKLEIEKQHLELQLVELETVKQENENASQLVGQYHEKNNPCANIAIGLDYDALNINKKVEGDKGKTTISEDVSAMLRKVGSPLFKACEVNFSEKKLIIKQELADEDNEKKYTKTTPPSKTEKKPMVDQTPKNPIKEVKTENAGKKKKNRNRKIGINKRNNFAFVADAPRK
ncbi:hypothetical protein AgCh_026209 [Apium graveolens]